MGLWDKYKSMFAGPAIDVASEIGKNLPAGERVLANAQVIPSAYERGGGAFTLQGKLFDAVASAVENTVSGRRHVGGADGTIATRLPREADPHMLVITERSMSLWDLGMMGNSLPAEHVATIPREAIASFSDTGQKAQGGVPVARVEFTDGSFFDYRLMSKPGDEFWAVARVL